MQIVNKIKEMQKIADDCRAKKKTISFVPTMGYLHEGHLSLIDIARENSDFSVASIFVNPTQFSENEDLDSYPNDLEKDIANLEKKKCDLLFLPSKEELYPASFQSKIYLEKLPNYLCGVSRPHHFAGVAQIVTKLFNIVKPHVAVFGKKDYQQFLIIKQMVYDLNFDIKIIGGKIIRDEDGLAKSSRNSYLSVEERKAAPCLYKALLFAQKLFEEGERKADIIIKKLREIIEKEPFKIDYITISDVKTLEPQDEIKDTAHLALAAKIGKTRLIDNIVLK